MKLETVFIDVDGAKVMINKSDFDQSKHKEWKDQANKPSQQKAKGRQQ